MKKIVYLFLLSMALVACNSTEEIYDELDKADTGLVYDLQYTLKAADYTTAGEAAANFSTTETASEKIPAILQKVFPQFGAGSSAVVNYNLYTPIRIHTASTVTLTPEDYNAIGESDDRLNSQGDITKAVAYKFPAPEENDVVTITYNYFASGATTTLTSKVTYFQAAWRISYIPTTADYAFMGRSFPDFDSRSTGRARIAVLFDRSFPFGAVGEYKTAIFTYSYIPTDGAGNPLPRVSEDFLVAYQFNGTRWVPFEDVTVTTLQLGNDGTAWVPDNTIKYTLASADFTAIGNATATSNPAGSASAIRYGNFDVSLWSRAQIIDAIGARLLTLFPAAAEGQKYLVTYATYSGVAGTAQVHLILEGGEYVEVE